MRAISGKYAASPRENPAAAMPPAPEVPAPNQPTGALSDHDLAAVSGGAAGVGAEKQHPA